MKVWSVEPRDTAIFRDARPFEAGSAATSLPFPWPSTVAGFTRSRLGMSDAGEFEWTPDQARSKRVMGPWLLELDPHSGKIIDHLFPAPRDAVFFRPEDAKPGSPTVHRRGLAPRITRDDEWTDLPEDVQLVDFLERPDRNPGKPFRGPAFWSGEAMKTWLEAGRDGRGFSSVDYTTLGLMSLPRERRIHVKMNAESQTADDGFLFQTEQLRFLTSSGDTTRRFAIALGTDDDCDDRRMTRGADSFGGERRMAFVQAANQPPLEVPDIGDADIVRVVLLTPAIFEHGWMPAPENLGNGVEVIAASVDRYQPVSGWSFEHRGPKPTRRMAPAGSVYWLRIPQSAHEWARKHHFTSISDDEQDRLDGFGLIAVGRA